MRTKSKLLSCLLVAFMTFLFAGCDSIFPAQSDPEIQELSTKEEALQFIIDKAETWNVVKAKASLSIIPLPAEGHIDFANHKIYVEEYKTNENKEREVTKYLYLLNETLYSCENTETGPKYSITTMKDEYDVDLDVNDLFDVLDISKYDLSTITFSKTDSQITFSTNYSFEGTSYNIQLSYKNKSIIITIKNMATITLTKDDPEYFNNLNLDLTPFENLK